MTARKFATSRFYGGKFLRTGILPGLRENLPLRIRFIFPPDESFVYIRKCRKLLKKKLSPAPRNPIGAFELNGLGLIVRSNGPNADGIESFLSYNFGNKTCLSNNFTLKA